ncbi:alpha 1,4-glycosyltransferase family protein [Actinidia rufa]|uniref:Alpha 1,4-glycosyltransferase family protein n=1 Tax=Actinidia rufa TaxID=165716 RepID=A0A7J0EZH3_9ERIC|nr:alpha 1,4-glycosyltransferase family protein [Actinidia rufa]
MATTNPPQLHQFLSLHCLHKRKRSLLALLSLPLLLLLACNGASVLSLQAPFPASFSPENCAGKSRKWASSSTKLSSTAKRMGKRKPMFKFLLSEAGSDRFSTRVKEFFGSNSCQSRFFMTWISSIDSFGDRELFTVESLFRSHPHGCLIIVSNSMDSTRGIEILRPFLSKGFHVNSISPDFDYLLKHTVAESWFNRLRNGDVDPGEVSLGQNLSNLLRLALLYKFGGVYIDTDVIILKSLSKLRNVIGAQTIDLETGNWSRLNNAVMVFDKGHPLLYKFIQEFALTFDGNKWGHHGPYLVSRVVSRVKGRLGFDFGILSPIAFYPVDWSRIDGLFWGPRNETHSKWLSGKLNHIRSQSYAVHLWNRQSRKIDIEEGSIIGHLMSDSCVFCNSSALNL